MYQYLFEEDINYSLLELKKYITGYDFDKATETIKKIILTLDMWRIIVVCMHVQGTGVSAAGYLRIAHIDHFRLVNSF